MTDNSKQSRWSIPSAVSSAEIYGYSSEGWKFGNASVFSNMPLNIDLAYPFVVEYRMTDSDKLSPIQILMNSNNQYIGWNYGANGNKYTFTNNGGGLTPSEVVTSLTNDTVFKLEVTNTHMKLYANDVLIADKTHTLRDNHLKFIFQTGNNRYIVVKDFKIEPL